MGKKALGMVSAITMGQSPSSETYNTEGVGLPFYQGKTDFGIIHPSVRVYCDKPQKTAKTFDILISVRAPVGATNIADQHCCIGRGLAAITALNDVSFYKYIYYYLKHCEKDIEHMGVGSTFKAISRKDIELISIPLPPFPIQQKIADILDRASILIEKRKQQIAKLDLLVKSQFIEMFGDPVTNSRNMPTEALGELCNIFRGGSPRPIDQYLGGTIPWIKIGDATGGDDTYLHSTKDFIIEDGMRKSRYVKSGSLIFANCGVSLGFARIITFDGCIHDGWLSFEDIDERLNKEFLLKSLNHCTAYFRDTAPDGTQPNLNTGIMKSFRQILPPLPLQNRFADFVRAADKLKVEMQRGLGKLELLYKSLMQKCFNGEMFSR